ncbi:DUF1801 domain-containing protein [Maricaulis sp. W15]|uniref:DUF1801 domain-containing protein n=1 Tax=Maricaulis sp. W15 TaxID=1772333 RepID=UPI000B21B07D|nr:DUF1801 domain-containing protein [Maricaulis sp. W15]
MDRKAQDYFDGLADTPRPIAFRLRDAVLATGLVTEAFKWGHPVYQAAGLVCLIKAASRHVTLGFWQGGSLTGLDPRLTPSGRAHMATMMLASPESIDPENIARLVKAAVNLDREQVSS